MREPAALPPGVRLELETGALAAAGSAATWKAATGRSPKRQALVTDVNNSPRTRTLTVSYRAWSSQGLDVNVADGPKAYC